MLNTSHLEAPPPARTVRYGAAAIAAYAHRHQRLAGDGAWAGHTGPYPIIAGTVLRVVVDRLPGDRSPKPLWMWSSAPEISATDLAGLFFAFCRRFDIERCEPHCCHTRGSMLSSSSPSSSRIVLAA